MIHWTGRHWTWFKKRRLKISPPIGSWWVRYCWDLSMRISRARVAIGTDCNNSTWYRYCLQKQTYCLRLSINIMPYWKSKNYTVRLLRRARLLEQLLILCRNLLTIRFYTRSILRTNAEFQLARGVVSVTSVIINTSQLLSCNVKGHESYGEFRPP